jgi:hypothetical protein
MSPELSMTGACCCGAVTFEIQAQPTDVYCCHCTICQRSTGVQGVAVVVVPNALFAWSQGQAHVRHWRKPDADWEKNFCAVCGSPLPGANDATTTYVPVGLLTQGAGQLQIKAHIFTESMAPWFQPGDNAPQHPGHLKD